MATLLSVRQVSKAFGGLQALRNVSLELAAGEILGIIGPNGAGKSTLFNVISGQLKPDRGDVTFDGHLLSDRPANLVARLGLIKTYQTSRLFYSMTFLENVMVGALSQEFDLARAEGVALQKLEAVGLGERPGTPAAWASTGQRKRLEIARALATEPRLLLLDEPFGGVDLPSVDSLVNVLRRLRDNGITLLIIEHNLDAVHRLVDRLLAMHLGEAISEGTAEAVTSDPRVVQAYLGSSQAAHA